MNESESRIFELYDWISPRGPLMGVLITPKPVPHTQVQAALAYALRHTAKNLDTPDPRAALEMIKQRHPSWEILPDMKCIKVKTTRSNLKLDEQDKPE